MEGRKKTPLSGIGLALLAALAAVGAWGPAAGPGFSAGQEAPVTLTPDLSIGVEDGDENFMFGSMDVPGRPFCADSQGRIYFAVSEGFPMVIRYAVRKTPGGFLRTTP